MDVATQVLTLVVDLWTWPQALQEIDMRVLAFGVRRRSQRSRWRGLSMELVLEIEGPASQVLLFSRFVETAFSS